MTFETAVSTGSRQAVSLNNLTSPAAAEIVNQEARGLVIRFDRTQTSASYLLNRDISHFFVWAGRWWRLFFCSRITVFGYLGCVITPVRGRNGRTSLSLFLNATRKNLTSCIIIDTI